MPLGMRVVSSAPLTARPTATTHTSARRDVSQPVTASPRHLEGLAVRDADDRLDDDILTGREARRLDLGARGAAAREPPDVREAVGAAQHDLDLGARAAAHRLLRHDHGLPRAAPAYPRGSA